MTIKVDFNKKKSKVKKVKDKPKKKKLEFAQKWLIGCMVISVVFTSLSYILSWFDKNPVESLSMTIIQTLWSSTGFSFAGYTVLNSVRAVTGSVWGIPNNTDINNINTINNSLDQTNISLQNLGDFSAENSENNTENDMNSTENTEYNPKNNRGI